MNDKTEELISGYALGILDEAEQIEAEQILKTDPAAQTLLRELQDLTAGLALSVDPVELPTGSLERLRQKANLEKPNIITRRPQAQIMRKMVSANQVLAYAAVLFVFVAAGLIALIMLGSGSPAQQALKALETTPGMLKTELKKSDAKYAGTIYLLSDVKANKAYLVTKNMTALSSDQEYEAWLIGSDEKPQKAGMLGAGGNKDEPLISPITMSAKLDQYQLVAITVEKRGGTDQPSQAPIMSATIVK